VDASPRLWGIGVAKHNDYFTQNEAYLVKFCVPPPQRFESVFGECRSAEGFLKLRNK
jgi:hypothetical protein